jgi:hypothetical protein
MQIHEITNTRVDEGLLDLAKKAAGGIKGAVQGYQTARADRRTAQSSAAVSKKAIAAWDQYARNLKAITPDPARYNTVYQQALTAFVQKNLLAGQNINSAINKQEITQLITQITAANDNPQQVATLIPKLVQQAAVSQQDVTTATNPLVKIISINPPVIQYRTISYALNQQGEWANQTTGKVPDESFGKFLDQEARNAGVSI